MRDPNRIDPMLDAIREFWKINPDMRLGQLIVTISPAADPFYVEDDKMMKNLENLIHVLYDPPNIRKEDGDDSSNNNIEDIS